MSLKPPKKSDLDKNWMKARRDIPKKIQPEYHLIITEGTEYTKNRTDMYQILFPYMDTAIANAKKLDKINADKLPSASAPGTKVHLLVEKLKPYLTDQKTGL